MIRKFLQRSEFTRNVLTLMTGTTIAQAIPFLVSPILSRLYMPEDFDVLALYLAVVNLFAPIITGTYEQAIILPREEGDAVHVAGLTALMVAVFSMASIPVVVFFNHPITQLLNNPKVSPWLYLVPAGLFLASMTQVLTYWSMRNKLFGNIAGSRVGQSVSTAAVNLGFGAGVEGASGLVLGNLLGQGLAAGMLGYPVWKSRMEITTRVNGKGLKAQMKKYRNFPLFTLPQTFLDGIKESGLIFLISSLFVAGTLGSYSFTVKILKMPLNLMGVAISQVFYQKAAERYNSGEPLFPLLRDVLVRLVVIALPILALLVLFGPQLFAFVFGPEWTQAGRFARILAPWLLVQFISSPVSQIPLILGRQKAFLFIAAVLNILIPATFALAAFSSHDIEVSLLVISIITSLYLVGVIVWIARLTRLGRHLTGAD